MPLSCIIIEDQAPAQRVLKKYIEDIGTLQLKNTFSDALKALEFLKTEQVELIFLDIHLPKISGIDFLRTLDYKPHIILTTAFSDYAVQSYEFSVVDYLVKPFSFERFVKAISKVKTNLHTPKAAQEPLPPIPDHDFFIKTGHEYIKVNSEHVLFIKSDMDYTEVHVDGKKLLSSETLSFWEEKLSPLNFVRVHKSYLINPQQIEKIAGNQIYMPEGHIIPIGRAFKDDFIQRFVK